MILTPKTEIVQDFAGGRHIAELHMRPIAYQRQGDPTWRRLSNVLSLSGDPNFAIGVDELMQFRVRNRLSGNAPVVHIGYKDEYVRLTPLSTNNVDAIVDGQSTTFLEAWNNADLKYTIIGHALKKEIFLRAGHPASFSFQVDTGNFGDKLKVKPPYLYRRPLRGEKPGALYVPLEWIISTQRGKQVYTVTLPAGSWDGYIIDPTFTSDDGDFSQDVYLDDTFPTTNNDGAGLYIGDAGGSKGRALIKFTNLSDIPSDATINSATFSLYADTDYSSNARTFYMYRVLRNWTETGATWNTYNGSNSWSTAGCGNSTTDYNSTVHGSRAFTATETMNQFKNFTMVASEFQKFIDGTYTNNYGWLIRNPTESNDMYYFLDSEYATASNRPKITADYTEAGGSFFAMF